MDKTQLEITLGMFSVVFAIAVDTLYLAWTNHLELGILFSSSLLYFIMILTINVFFQYYVKEK